jgi:TPR repeat protein/GTPase SAR1 family protein
MSRNGDNEFRQARKLLKAGKGVAAVEHLRAAAQKGHRRAVEQLYELFSKGLHGVKRDKTEAYHWAGVAIDKGWSTWPTETVSETGDRFWIGKGVLQNAQTAAAWWRRAAEKGDAEAMHNLGVCYANGNGVEKSAEKAVEWYTRASEKGDAKAMNNLGSCYGKGNGVEKSVEKAVELWTRAAKKGSAMSMRSLGVCYANGNGVEKSAEKAVEWYTRAAENGDAEAMSDLGECYDNGTGVEKSAEKAVECWTRAAANDNETAMHYLGACFENGNGVEKSVEKAFQWWRRAAQKGDRWSLFNLAECMLSSRGARRDEAAACDLLTRLCATGDVDLFWRFVRSRCLHSVVRPFDDFSEALRIFTELKSDDEARWTLSLQFAARSQQSQSSSCSAAEVSWLNRIAERVGGATGKEGDDAVLARATPLMVPGRNVPFELYSAVKQVVDARVKKLDVKSVLPLACVLDELDRAALSLDFSDPHARQSVRACVFGAMYEHIVAARSMLPSDLTSETAVETALLWAALVNQLAFFGRVPAKREKEQAAMAAIERRVDDRLRSNSALRNKYAMSIVLSLKRRLPQLLLTTPEFAASSAAKLDGKVENKRVKVILLGDSGAGKTQIRRRLGGKHAFEAEHNSTDTAEVTSVQVTSLTLASKTRWEERDAESAAGRMQLYGPAAARSLMSMDGRERLGAKMCDDGDDGDRQTLAPKRTTAIRNESSSASSSARIGSTVSGAASAPAPPIAIAEPPLSTSASSSAAAIAAASFVPSEVGFEMMDERTVLSLWDFGGQTEYFAVHDLFLTRGAVYVLVVDWTKGVEKARESAQRWMDAIRAHVDDALVLPVLPRCGAASVGDQKLDEVASEIETLVGRAPVRVDSAVDFNYDVLKRELLSVVEMRLADPTTHVQVPLRWLRAHDELCRLRAEKEKQWVSRGEFRDLLQSLYRVGAAAVSDEDVARTLEYLKQSGTVLTCGGSGRVSEYVFLEPELFLALVRPLINTSEQLEMRKKDAVASTKVVAEQRALSEALGQFGATCVASRALLEHVWRAIKSPTGEIGFFVELLEWCGLMCELEAGKYFVPAASKATPSTGLALDWLAGAEQIALVCVDEKISALPPSLLPRIVASLFKGGAIMPPTKLCVVTQSDVVLQLRASTGASARRVRLQQGGNRVVLTLQRRASDDDVAARAWRLRAYTALYVAVECVVRLVFGSLSLSTKASVLCAKCNVWLPADICSSCDADLASIDAWLPRDDDAIKLQRNDWTSVAPWPITVTAAAMRVVYFSASPQWKTPLKQSESEWPKLAWDAEFEKMQRATNSIDNKRVELSFEFHDKGTLDELERVLTANSSVPTILVIACHGDEQSGALQFSELKDSASTHVIDAGKLKAALERTRHRLALTVFCSCCSALLAPSIQHVAHVPCFVTFGTKRISAEHTTLFLTALFEDVVTNSAGTHFVDVVERAKQRLLNLATMRARPELTTFANKILWSTSRAPRN